MNYELRKVQEADVDGKTVLLRADLDVPLENGKITDDSRLTSWFPTLELLLKNGAKVVVAGHLGRPEKQFPISPSIPSSGPRGNFQFPKENEKYSIKPVAQWIAAKINSTIQSIELEGFKAWKLAENVSILENLRFYDEEEKNPLTSSGQVFSKKLASLAQIYVNDAFASSHRAHASIVGVTKYLPSFAGLRLQKEVEELSKVLENPNRPLTIIIGGAKIETKLPLVEKMHHFADYVLVGGEIAEHTRELAKVAHEKITGKKSILLVADLTADDEDISDTSIQNFIQVINSSKTIVWNGPMGEFEKGFEKGTKELAKAVANSNAYTIAGGGETIEFLKKEGLLDNFKFVSTGGGAMLEFLAGSKLPGLVVLEK